MNEKNIADLVYQIQDLKLRLKDATSELTAVILDDPTLISALRSGLIKLNFPAPAGFYRRIKTEKLKKL